MTNRNAKYVTEARELLRMIQEEAVQVYDDPNARLRVIEFAAKADTFLSFIKFEVAT